VSDAKAIVYTTMQLGFGTASYVYAWTHNVTGLVLTLLAGIALALMKE